MIYKNKKIMSDSSNINDSLLSQLILDLEQVVKFAQIDTLTAK